MIDFSLTREQEELREAAAGYAARELAPRVEEVYRSGAAEPWPLLEPAHRRAAEMGLVAMLVPEEHGGGGASCVDAALVLEELGAADVAFAASAVAQTMALGRLVARHGSDEQRRAWLRPFAEGAALVLGGALSEPDRAGSDLFAPFADPGVGPRTTAARGADGWRISGTKSAFVTNAGIADAYFVMARTRTDVPPAQGLSMLRVPADAAGLSVGPRTRLSGWHTATHAELRFDDVRVPDDALVGPEHGAGLVFAGTPEVAIGLAACLVGLARAAHELAVGYARERRSWGVPIARHQAVALRLGESAIDLHAARLVVWEAARAADLDPLRGAARAPAAKVHAVDAAIRCAQRAVETLGAYGVTDEYRAARLLNDAWVAWSCDFTRDLLVLQLAERLAGAPT